MAEPVVIRAEEGFLNRVEAGKHAIIADEPSGVGGTDQGPTPYDLLAAALGTCKSMTLRMYADRKQWPLESIEIAVTHGREHASDCESCLSKEGYIHRFNTTITIRGNLDDGQRARLLEIAGKCPVAKTLSNEIVIVDELSSDR